MDPKYNQYDTILNTPAIGYDFLDFFMGDYLGKGYSRSVFEHKKDKKLVVKIDINSKGSNFAEWETWKTVKGTKHEKWFAPCMSISDNGKILIQQKCKPIEYFHTIPKMIPAYFNDVHMKNFGIYNGRLVCFDYALNNLLKMGLTKEMIPIKWNLPQRYTCSQALK